MDAHTTLVVYMGLSTLPEVTRRLVVSGLAADTPAVAVERGTLPTQRAVFAPLQVGQLARIDCVVTLTQLTASIKQARAWAHSTCSHRYMVVVFISQDLQRAVQEHELQSPTLIVIGDVVSLAPGWQAQLAAGRSDVVPSSGQYMHLQTPGQLSARGALGEAAFSQML